MTTKFNKLKIYTLYLIGFVFGSSVLFGGTSFAADDLLKQLIEPAKESQTIIDLGENVNTVGHNVIGGSIEISTDGAGVNGSLIVKITRLILMLTIALSVTMILYKGFLYILESGKGGDGKKHLVNVVRIVVGILIALFSVVIINLIQSIPKTLDEELINTTDMTLGDKDKQSLKQERELIKGKKLLWNEVEELFDDI